MEPTLPTWATQLMWNVLIWTALVSFLTSVLLRFLPLPGVAEDQIHNRVYLIVYNILRRVSVNAPYQPNRNGNGGAKVAGILLLALLLPAGSILAQSTQVDVSFACDPAPISKKITGGVPSLKDTLYCEVFAVNNTAEARAVTPAAVYIAARVAGFAVVGPATAEFLMNRIVTLHWSTQLTNFGGDGMAMAGAVGAYTGRFPGWLSASLPVAGILLKELGGRIAPRAPDFTGLRAAVLKDNIALMPGEGRSWIFFATAAPEKCVNGFITAMPIQLVATPTR